MTKRQTLWGAILTAIIAVLMALASYFGIVIPAQVDESPLPTDEAPDNPVLEPPPDEPVDGPTGVAGGE